MPRRKTRVLRAKSSDPPCSTSGSGQRAPECGHPLVRATKRFTVCAVFGVVKFLRAGRGRERLTSHERILGRSEFVECAIAETQETPPTRITLDELIERVCSDVGKLHKL